MAGGDESKVRYQKDIDAFKRVMKNDKSQPEIKPGDLEIVIAKDPFKRFTP